MNVVAKKQFGQNFLKDTTVLDKIIKSMPNNSNSIVEIGPGLGDLTVKLLELKDVIAYEVDRDLCPILNDKFRTHVQQKRLGLICTDVLDFWEEHSSLCSSKFDLVANLPYYISTSIVLKALEDSNCENILVMTQLEVAQKFCATYGQKEHGFLSIMSELIGKTTLLFEVPPSSFEPIPKVTSAVLLISKNDSGVVIEKGFKKFLKIAFAQPRKTFVKNLSSSYNKERVLEILQELDIKTNTRGHEIPSSKFYVIYKKLIKGK
jgi:16S rRNA (adenine1518-N6/adenine1519-N6)-dimethyltransferase